MIKFTIFLSIIFLALGITEQTIYFSSPLASGNGFTFDENIITLTSYQNYYEDYRDRTFRLVETNIDKSILVSSSAKIILDSLTLVSSGKLTPLIIDKNCDVILELRGTSNLVDSSTNENGGIIHLREGAKLTITGSGILNLMINKFVAINGENSTSLYLNGGIIKIISTENSAGGIKIGKDIIFNGATFTYEAITGENPSIFAGASIIINSGTFNIKSGKGKIFLAGDSIIMNSGLLNLETSGEKGFETNNSIYFKKGTINLKSFSGMGIKAEKNIYFGVKDDNNSDLKIYIESLNKGIEARGMEIYSGNITINSKSDGIKISNDICNNEKCSGECTCYIKIYGGDVFINSEENGIDSNGDIFTVGGKLILFGASNGEYQPITQCGLLKIINGTIFTGGTSGNGGIIANTTQYSFIYNKYIDKNSLIQIYDTENNILIVNMTNPKEMDYLYFNYPYKFIIKINGKEIDNSDGNNMRTLISSEYEDLDYKSDSIIMKETIQNNNIITSSMLESNKQTQKEKNDAIPTNLRENVKTYIDENNISTIPNKNYKTQKLIIENSEINDKIISSFPKQNNHKNLISSTLSQNIKSQEIISIPQSHPQKIKSHIIESTFSKQFKTNIKITPKSQINQYSQTTFPKESAKNFLGKSTILNQDSENQDNKINKSTKPKENIENMKDSYSIIDSEQEKATDYNSLNENNYNLSGFIKMPNLLIILIGIIL